MLDNIDRLIDLEYCNVTEEELRNYSPKPIRWFSRDEDPAKTLMRIMRDPDHFAFTCKHLLDLDVLPEQNAVLVELWNHPFPLLAATRGWGKSFLLALYSVLRAFIMPGTKVVITGMGFRQAKQVLNYTFRFWDKAPIFRSLYADDADSGKHPGNDRYVLRLGDSAVTGLPMGDGQAIRGERANVTIGDEFASITREVFETVVVGFGVVSQDPIRQVREKAFHRVLKAHDLWTEQMAAFDEHSRLGNQTIISGTCYYQFNHFYTYWRRYKQIIESGGDPEKLKAAFAIDGVEVPPNLDYRKFAVVRIPMELTAEGYVDQDQVARSQATMHSGTFNNEYRAVFSTDTNGFFSRLLIESCCTKTPVTPKGTDEQVLFHAVMHGAHDGRYVLGVDPAADNDRLTIVVLEIHPTHRRVVHCWSTNRKEYQKRVEGAQTDETDYYGFIARRIRTLMKSFHVELISMDAQGGGGAVLEALGDANKLKEGESPLYPVTRDHALHDGKARLTDNWSGRHIVEMVEFSNASYVYHANHDMRLDLEDKVLLFPRVDSAAIAVAGVEDELMKRTYDTHEDVFVEIEELKDELATITHSQTPGTLRDHWDTPEVKLPGSKKGRLRKDRYSALLMANYAARRMARKVEAPPMEAVGGYIDDLPAAHDGSGPLVHGPDWYRDAMEGCWEHMGSL